MCTQSCCSASVFARVVSFAAAQFFACRPSTRSPLGRPLAAHVRELDESFQTSYCRPLDDVVMAVSFSWQRFGCAKSARSLVLCCMLSSVHAGTTRPLHSCDAPICLAGASVIFSWCSLRTGASSLHYHRALLRAAPRAAVPVHAAGVHVSCTRQVQPGQPLPPHSRPPCAAMNAHDSATRAHDPPAPVLCSGATPRAGHAAHGLFRRRAPGELRGGAEAGRPVLGQVDDARHDG